MKNTYRSNILKLTLSAMFMAIGLVLPLLTGQIKTIGNMLLPMHIPVMLCGLICGWYYGAAVGFILPILRSVTFGMPELYPSA
ncbi:MAG: ECF transporter S component, partial [Clostridia bacterium]|nr:ECF transporter S component [Clostridia bacterium]